MLTTELEFLKFKNRETKILKVKLRDLISKYTENIETWSILQLLNFNYLVENNEPN